MPTALQEASAASNASDHQPSPGPPLVKLIPPMALVEAWTHNLAQEFADGFSSDEDDVQLAPVDAAVWEALLRVPNSPSHAPPEQAMVRGHCRGVFTAGYFNARVCCRGSLVGQDRAECGAVCLWHLYHIH